MSSHLSRLHLRNCRFSKPALTHASAALAQLPNLRAVSLAGTTPLGLLSQATGLTSLSLKGDYLSSAQGWVGGAVRNTQLQHLSVQLDRDVDGLTAFSLSDEGPAVDLPAASVLQLLSTCSSITTLDLPHSILNQAGLDELLTHGTRITCLNLATINITQDRSGAECQLRQLGLLQRINLSDVRQLAWLPLKSVERFSWLGDSEPRLILCLDDSVPFHELPGLLRQAASKLASSPAWRIRAAHSIVLCGSPHHEEGNPDAIGYNTNPLVREQLLAALEPLGAPAVRAFELDMRGCSFQLGRAELQALQHSLGQDLESLSCANCELQPDIWHTGPVAAPGAAPVFRGIQAYTSLKQLHLQDCLIADVDLQPAAAALAQLENLTDVSLQGTTPLGLLSYITGLTKLALKGPCLTPANAWVHVAACNTQLQVLVVELDSYSDRAADSSLPAAALGQLLTTCRSLSLIQLPDSILDQAALDVLLDEGANITCLSLGRIDATQDRSDKQCTWRELSLASKAVQQFAYLPLRMIENCNSFSRVLRLSLEGSTSGSQLAGLLSKAISNLVACPAWQRGKADTISLSFPEDANFTREDRVHLLQALAPVAGVPHFKALELSDNITRSFRIGNNTRSFGIGRAEVEALQHSCGQGLESLKLSFTHLSRSFWAAVTDLLPSVRHIYCSSVTCEHLVEFCRTRPASNPITLYLSGADYKFWLIDKAKQAPEKAGVSHVKICWHSGY
jgi:hypothetical protein